MRRIVRWVDGAGRVSVGVEVDNEGHFRKLSGIEDPMPFLRGEMFSPEGHAVTPVDPYSLELGNGPHLDRSARPARGVVRGGHVRAEP